MEFKTGTTDVPGAFPFASEAYRGDPDAWAARRAEVGAATLHHPTSPPTRGRRAAS